jgi:hypothetical protein
MSLDPSMRKLSTSLSVSVQLEPERPFSLILSLIHLRTPPAIVVHDVAEQVDRLPCPASYGLP